MPKIVIGPLLLCLLAGCGASGNPDEPGLTKGADGVKAVISIVTKAMAEGNGGRACSLIDPRAQQRLVTATASTDCLSAVQTWHTQHPTTKGVEPDDIKVELHGTTAKATTPTDFAPLASDGTWTMDTIESRWTVI